MVKLFKFMKDGKTIGITYSDKDGNVTPPDGATAVEITEDEKAAAIAQQKADMPTPFDVVVFQTSLAQLLLTGAFSNANLRFEFAAIIAYVTNGNFAGLYQYAQWLISQGIATADDLTAINNICKLQGIDLENLGGN